MESKFKSESLLPGGLFQGPPLHKTVYDLETSLALEGFSPLQPKGKCWPPGSGGDNWLKAGQRKNCGLTWRAVQMRQN